MKTTGIVRRVDDLGRIVIPSHVRKELSIKDGTPMELYIEDGCLIFKHYSIEELLESTLNTFSEVVNTYVDEDDYGQDIKARLIDYINKIGQILEERKRG